MNPRSLGNSLTAYEANTTLREEAIDSEQVNLAPNESRRPSFGEQPIEVGPGNYTYGVYSGDGDLTATLTVEEPGDSGPGGGPGDGDGSDDGENSDDRDDFDEGDNVSDDGDGSDDGPTTEPLALVISQGGIPRIHRPDRGARDYRRSPEPVDMSG